jgi:hypothetical protein
LAETERPVDLTTEGDAILDTKNNDALQFEEAGVLLWLAFTFLLLLFPPFLLVLLVKT